MYTPNHFRVTAFATVASIIRANSFGILVSPGGDGMMATHVPFLLNEPTVENPNGSLITHVARANPAWRLFENTGEVLVLFQGVHGYISPTWYETAKTKAHVPTWDYEAVHVYGTPRIIADESALLEILHRTVDAYEPADLLYRSRALPESFLANNAKAVVGFEIPIRRWEAKLKMSQNRDVADVLSVLAHLEKSDDQESRKLAAAIRSANQSRIQESTSGLGPAAHGSSHT